VKRTRMQFINSHKFAHAQLVEFPMGDPRKWRGCTSDLRRWCTRRFVCAACYECRSAIFRGTVNGDWIPEPGSLEDIDVSRQFRCARWSPMGWNASKLRVM